MLFLGIVIIMLLVVGCTTKKYECPNGDLVVDMIECNIEDTIEVIDDDIGQEVVEDSNNQNLDLVEKETMIDNEVVEKKVQPQLTLSDLQKNELNNILVNRKSAVYPPMLSVNEQVPVGGTHTFAYAIKNTAIQEKEFKYSIELLSSKSISLSNTEADVTVLDWFALTDLDKTYMLGKNEVAYIPIVIVVGDKITENGKDTIPGTYKFRITSEIIDGPFTDDHHYVDFVLRVTD